MGLEDNKVRVSPYAEFYRLFKNIGLKSWGSPVWTDTHRIKYTAWGSWRKASAPYIYNPFEIVMIGYKDTWTKEKKGVSTISKEQFMNGCMGVWKLRTQTKELTKANFHTDLPDMCINLLSFVDDLVYDPFMGGGTTAVSCVRAHRNYIGSEISPNYCKVAEERIMKANDPVEEKQCHSQEDSSSLTAAETNPES
jgi:site-specific DNA-methyltransferase (adenine-specific)